MCNSNVSPVFAFGASSVESGVAMEIRPTVLTTDSASILNFKNPRDALSPLEFQKREFALAK